MTMTGTLVGSPAHMAPEIIEGEAAGAEADIFSLGTMLYLFATGTLPFNGPNTTATLKRIVDGSFEDPRALRPTVSDGLAQVIATCLARQPRARYPDAGALAAALEGVLAPLGLIRCDEELTRFFLDPGAYRKVLVPRLVEALLARAEALAAEHKVARAMAALDQVLAHQPHHPRAEALLAAMQVRRQRDRRLATARRLALVTGLGLAALAAGGLAVERAFRLAPATVVGAEVPPGARTPGPPPPAPAPEPAVDSAPRLAARTVPARPAPPPQTEVVEVAVVVRPFGVVRVDGGPPTAEPLARHTLRLRPGPHRFAVSCAACDPASPPVERLVRAGEDVLLVAPLQPSQVSFSGFPDQARVRVGAEERTVAEARVRPFAVVTPPAGSPKLLHLVDYAVTLDGEVLERASRWVEPGALVVLERGSR
jgi:serine/threonine-protein kinase